MSAPERLEMSLAKAEYLLTRAAAPGQGGDKQNFWRNILAFDSAAAIRNAILREVSVDMLEPKGKSPFGERYQAQIRVTGANGLSRPILTAWIVRSGEDTARFVTAVPTRRKKKQP
ncbi:DUF6883 domain-containing protein [Leptolyngbya sp. PCC 6406]|nr:DUF6883 domain-containing protein [Leptolyngbya sp. PCC 6406]